MKEIFLQILESGQQAICRMKQNNGQWSKQIALKNSCIDEFINNENLDRCEVKLDNGFNIIISK